MLRSLESLGVARGSVALDSDLPGKLTQIDGFETGAGADFRELARNFSAHEFGDRAVTSESDGLVDAFDFEFEVAVALLEGFQIKS